MLEQLLKKYAKKLKPIVFPFPEYVHSFEDDERITFRRLKVPVEHSGVRIGACCLSSKRRTLRKLKVPVQHSGVCFDNYLSSDDVKRSTLKKFRVPAKPSGIHIEEDYLSFDEVKRSTFKKLRVPAKPSGIHADEDYLSKLYPSSGWLSENRDRFSGRKPEPPGDKREFVITSLDTRKHNPHPKQIFHIKRIDNKKPVCTVQSWVCTDDDKVPSRPGSSVYKVSFKERPTEPIRIIQKQEMDKPIEGIVPVNMPGSNFDIRSEMMLPVCDSTTLPSAHNPHRYLLRKRKVPPPFNSHSGIVYPSLEHPRMTSYTPGMTQTGSLPFPNEGTEAVIPKDLEDRTSISTLSGMSFSRRKFIRPPSSHIKPGFDGGLLQTTSNKFNDRYLPFIRSKTII